MIIKYFNEMYLYMQEKYGDFKYMALIKDKSKVISSD